MNVKQKTYYDDVTVTKMVDMQCISIYIFTQVKKVVQKMNMAETVHCTHELSWLKLTNTSLLSGSPATEAKFMTLVVVQQFSFICQLKNDESICWPTQSSFSVLSRQKQNHFLFNERAHRGILGSFLEILLSDWSSI